MLLAASEGRHWRYEVCEHADGYIVQMRDLDTGAVDEDFATLFRTMPVAFAYAEMSAAMDRFASEDDVPDAEVIGDLEASERTFIQLSDRLGDGGTSRSALRAWEQRRGGQPRRALH